MLIKLDIEHNKQYTEKENAKTNGTEDQDQDQDVSVEEQPKKKTWRQICNIGKEIQNIMPNGAPKGNVPIIMAQSKLFIITC